MKWLFAFLSKFFTIREQKDSDVVKPFLEHLEDLRITLFKMAACLAVGMVVAFCFSSDLSVLIKKPLEPTGLKLVTFVVTEGFMISIRLAFYAGIVLSFPGLLYFGAEFVLPALTRKEKRVLFPGILISFVLFAIGVVISYVYILPKTLLWFAEYNRKMGFEQILQAGQYYGFVTHLTLACGLLSELPIVVIGLALMNIVSFRLMTSTRMYAYTAILILVAIISPSPDPATFVTLALPVIAIYELCIWIVWAIERRRRKNEFSGQTLSD